MALARTPDGLPVPSIPDGLNINISAYRVLYILLLLVQYRSLNVVELNRFLFENPLIQRSYNTETLTKYINTLREVGCEIPRSSSRNDYCYELLKSPFPLRLTPEELKIAEKLLGLICQQSDEALCNDFRALLEQLSWCIDRSSLPENLAREGNTEPFPELAVQRKRLNTYRQYCQDAFTLEIRYQPEGEPLLDLQLEPHQLSAEGRQLWLLGKDPRTQEQMTLDVDRIVSAKQLPSKNRRQASLVTVTFALYGRLAKSYRVYPGEKIVYQSADECQVKTKVADPSALISRLLKYGVSCQILSPDSVRKTMLQRIEHLLATVSEELSNHEQTDSG